MPGFRRHADALHRQPAGAAFVAADGARSLVAGRTRDGCRLAIVSGRDRADLQARVGIPGLIYAGNHGLEISGPGFVFVEPTAASQVEALQELAGSTDHKVQPITGLWWKTRA